MTGDDGHDCYPDDACSRCWVLWRDQAVKAERERVLLAFENELALSPWQHDHETVREFEKLIAKLRDGQ